MGEKIQVLRKDWRRRMNELGSSDIRTFISKILPERKNSQVSSLDMPNVCRHPSLSSSDIPSITVVHEAWDPPAVEVSPLRIVNRNSDRKCWSSSLHAQDLHSPLVSPYASPAFTPTIEVMSPSTGSPHMSHDTPVEDSAVSATTLNDSSISTQGITLMKRPLSTRLGHQVVDNREQSIIASDKVDESHEPRHTFTKRDLNTRPLPPSPSLEATGSEMIQALREELVAKARELKEEKLMLQKIIMDIRTRYEQSNNRSFDRSSSVRDSQDSANINSRLQWVEFESNCLKIENEILNKKVLRKYDLEQELHSLKEENSQLNSNLGRLKDLNKRVVKLEHHTTLSAVETSTSYRELCSIAPLSPHPNVFSQSYCELQDEMARVQSELLSNAADQRDEWDRERNTLVERIESLEQANLTTVKQLEEEQRQRHYYEQEFSRVEVSYSVLSESLQQQKARFQSQLDVIKSRVLSIDYAVTEASTPSQVPTRPSSPRCQIERHEPDVSIDSIKPLRSFLPPIPISN